MLILYTTEKNKFEALATTAQQASNLFFSMLISLLGLSLVILFPKSSGNVSLLMSSGMILVTPVMSVVSSIVNFAVSYPSFIRLVELINSLEHVSDEQIMENGEIEISNLSFKYPEMKYNIFHNFTVKISQGEQVIITGASGTGKTTLINLILGLEEEYEGEVIVGGVNTKLSNLDLRKDVCYISQPSKLFKGTLKENLELYLDSYHYDELVKLSDKIGLSELMNDISNFENILLLEDGRNFSLGQRQRLTLLRAFLGKYKLVIFDEPTSNLDFSHAKQIFSLIEKIDATKIIITHDKQFLDSSQTIIDLGGQNGYKIMQN
ncbi:bacteriocin ABC transporter ATP-binding/permease protein [Streptococcus infantarius subsp. infantarius]|nr:bacteriocin ABC transporter ATP-binding/permease protein [Streptococcus infantarius subsp. infantarius]MCO4491788.1 bacteriocin ABC transporter ATP-binding/permease protein [Streptococcus infantarius subsp. infantarius]MCO4518489.1 bacteriocin ABC transporter ATP-binding/permease protein [Streptococcus infantarius subsp. infantarius]